VTRCSHRMNKRELHGMDDAFQQVRAMPNARDIARG
jgi:hypothetical protein